MFAADVFCTTINLTLKAKGGGLILRDRIIRFVKAHLEGNKRIKQIKVGAEEQKTKQQKKAH